MTALNCLLVAATLASGNAEFDRLAATGAGEIAVARIVRELASDGPATGTLERAMLADPARFRSAAEAETACRELYSNAVDRAYAERAAAVRRQLKLGDDFAPTLPDADRVRAMDGFSTRFANERAAACAAQARRIAATIRPSEAEFESDDENALRQSMVRKVASAQKEPVFDENLGYISEKIVDPIIEDARREMKRQREYLSRTRCESYAPSALAKELEANLRKNLAERQTKSKDPSREWGVFPATLKSALPAVVAKRSLDRVVRAVDDVPMTVDATNLVQRMNANPSVHYLLADSEKRFRDDFATELLDGAIARAVREAPIAERDEYAAFLKARSSDRSLAKAADARVRRDLLPALKAARERISQDEMKDRWPTLADGTWHPDEAFADAILARSDSSQAIAKWRELDGMSALAHSGKTLLEETGSLADRSVAATFDRARNALAAQNQLVEQSYAEVLADAKDRKESFFRRTPDLAKIVEMLTDAVTDKWDDRRAAVLWPDGKAPKNSAEHFTGLFPSVKRRIELVARQILEEMEKPEPEDPPEETPEVTPENPQEPVMSFSISVEKSDGKVNVKLLQGKSALEDHAVDEKLSEFSDAMKSVSDRLGRDLLQLK